MPELSPRRSSRARATQPPPNKLTHNNSSSSTSSARAEKPTGANGSNEIAVRSPSANSEVDQLEPETRQTRRQKREQDAASDPHNAAPDEAIEEDDGEEEVTRCICGKPEYPGPPPALGIADPDVGGMFIQCDQCHVWQHGGCVGIMNDDETPDDYFCELCRPSLHKTVNGGRAQKYSRYLPVVEARNASPPRKKPASKEGGGKSSKQSDAKNAALYANGKRRATMNSRAAYEEDEMLRRALEESKGGNGTESSTSGPRKSKRAREDSDDSDHDLKRRKTGSESPPQSSAIVGDGDSDVEPARARGQNANPKGRSSRTQQDQEREFRRREKDREQERLAAANRRKDRMDRRHADEPEPSPEPTKTAPYSKPAASAQTRSVKAQPNIRQPNVSPPRAVSNPHKKPLRPTRKGKVGRNQYTRDRDAAADARAEAARTIQSRDGDDREGNASTLPNGSKPARPKQMHPTRTSMNELRKRAAGILEYISRTQIEMAGEKTPPGTQTPARTTRPPMSRPGSTYGQQSKLSREIHTEDHDGRKNESGVLSEAEMDHFKKMSSQQMMDVLAGKLVRWQHQHGRYGEK